MKLKKPFFWDCKKPTFFSYLLFPLSLITMLISNTKKRLTNKYSNIKTICVGNIYIGGTGKTPIAIELNKIFQNLNYNTCFIKKYYAEQIDEQKILAISGNLFCEKKRIRALNKAINKNHNLAIFDDGLQDGSISYDLTFVCFNIKNWVGNGFLIPAGPLRENLNNLKNYDGVFLNGNKENCENIKNIITNLNRDIKIFEAEYVPLNLNIFNNKANYLVFAGIGNPKTFKKTLEFNDINITEFLEFPDHYHYTNNDIKKIKLKAKKLNSKILTTEKDYLRLNKSNAEDIDFFKITLNIKEEEKLINFLQNKL
jgi:tetraacyldisaccharide 4'-kinase